MYQSYNSLLYKYKFRQINNKSVNILHKYGLYGGTMQPTGDWATGGISLELEDHSGESLCQLYTIKHYHMKHICYVNILYFLTIS